MSLINDALKRAKQTQPSNPPPADAQSPMQLANHRRSPGGLPIYFTPAVLAIVCGACFFLWRGWQEQHRLNASFAPTVVKAREIETAPAPDQGASLHDADAPGIPVGRNFSVDDDTPRPATASTAPAGPNFLPQPEAVDEQPKLGGHSYKLQGIFYRAANPSAVINAKSVFVGDKISNARVKAIDRQSVTLEVDGEIKVLTFQ